MLLSALGTLLDLEDDLEVVGLAQNGNEALELIRETSPDVVLTDIEMPELSGLELAERIRDEPLACRVIIVTTFARRDFCRNFSICSKMEWSQILRVVTTSVSNFTGRVS